MNQVIPYLGLDVHQETIAVSIVPQTLRLCASAVKFKPPSRRDAEPNAEAMLGAPELAGSNPSFVRPKPPGRRRSGFGEDDDEEEEEDDSRAVLTLFPSKNHPFGAFYA